MALSIEESSWSKFCGLMPTAYVLFGMGLLYFNLTTTPSPSLPKHRENPRYSASDLVVVA